MAAARTGYSVGLLVLACVGLSSSLQLTDDWIISQFTQIANRDAVQDSQISQQRATIKQQGATIKQQGATIKQQDSLINSLKQQVQQQQTTLSQLQHDSQQQATLTHDNKVKLEAEVSELREKLFKSQQDMQQQAATFYQTQRQLLTKVHDLKEEFSTIQQHSMLPSNQQGQGGILPDNEPMTSQPSHADLVQPEMRVTKVKDKGHAGVVKETASQNTSTSRNGNRSSSEHGIKKTQESLFRPSRLLLDGADEQITSPSDHVAFHAVVGSNIQNVDTTDAVKFETVLLNLGDAYHPQHGLFLAPVDGIYIFSVSITVMPTDNGVGHLDTALMRNTAVLGATYTYDSGDRRDQGAVTVVTQLDQGDEIWVKIKCCDGQQVFHDSFSSLTGALMFQL